MRKVVKKTASKKSPARKSAPSKRHLPDIVVLCGGLGTRLRPVLNDRPKVLAPIGDKTYLDILLKELERQGANRVILAVGHMQHLVADYLKKNAKQYPGLSIVISGEDRPLGTGGAVRNASGHVRSQHVIAINGDTLFEVPLDEVLNFHADKQGILSVVVSKRTEGNNFGSLGLAEDGRIHSVKITPAPGEPAYVSAGVYIISPDTFAAMTEPAFSMETDLMPAILPHGCYAFVSEKDFVDIGTPERYKQAQENN